MLDSGEVRCMQPLPSRSSQSGETDNLNDKLQHNVIILLTGICTRPRGSTEKGGKITEGEDGRETTF